MSATFIERCIRVGDWENDGGGIDVGALRTALGLFERADANMNSAGEIANIIENGLTQGQQDELEDVLGTMPGILAVLDRGTWADHVSNILEAGARGWSGYTSAAGVRTKLGLS